jgi:hypothetical protein
MDYDAATAAVALGNAAPAEIAQILIDRTFRAREGGRGLP